MRRLILLLLFIPLMSIGQIKTPPPPPVQEISEISEEKFEKISNSTVTIVVDGGMGSGFIFEEGKVLTNLHVIEPSSKGFVIVNSTQEKYNIEGYYLVNDKYDLTLLSVPELKQKPLTISKIKPKKGDSLFLIDNRLKSDKFILEGSLNYDSNPTGKGIIKTSIPADFGNSGAGILNSSGEIVGIMTFKSVTDITNYKGCYGYNLSVINEIKLLASNSIQTFNNYKNEHYYNLKGLEKVLQKDYSLAIIDLNKSIDINPKLFFSYLNRGLAKMKLKQANNAIKDFDNVLKLIPNFLDAVYFKGLSLAILKNYDDAIAQFDRYINIDDKFAMAYYYRGIAKGSNENLKGAIIDLNKAIELDKSNPDFYFYRAFLRKFSNDTIGSCEDLEKAKNLGSDKGQTLIEELCYETKKVEEDIEVPFAVIESVPEYPGCERGSNAEKRKCMSDKIAKFIQRRFNTDLALGLGLYGKQRISVIFKIDKKGDINDIKVRAPHPTLEEETIRVIKMLPKLKPGIQKGKPVIVPYSLPITFTIADYGPPPPKTEDYEIIIQPPYEIIIRKTFLGTEIDSVLTKKYGIELVKDVIRKDSLGYFYNSGIANKKFENFYVQKLEDFRGIYGNDESFNSLKSDLDNIRENLRYAISHIRSESFEDAFSILDSLFSKMNLLKSKYSLEYYPFESGIYYWSGVYYREIKKDILSEIMFEDAFKIDPGRL